MATAKALSKEEHAGIDCPRHSDSNNRGNKLHWGSFVTMPEAWT
jgi:hypothetical protein